MEDLDLGKWAEGIVEQDPMSGHYLVAMRDAEGRLSTVDAQEVLAAYKGQHVRIVITPFATIERLNKLVEAGEMGLEQASYVPPKGS